MTKPAAGTAVLLAYFGYCAAAMGAGAVALIDARNAELSRPIAPLQTYLLALWFVLFFAHLYGLFAPLMLANRMRRRAYGYFLGAATVGLLTIVPVLWLVMRVQGGGCSSCDLNLMANASFAWLVVIVLSVGFVLPLAIAWWWRRQPQPGVAGCGRSRGAWARTSPRSWPASASPARRPQA